MSWILGSYSLQGTGSDSHGDEQFLFNRSNMQIAIEISGPDPSKARVEGVPASERLGFQSFAIKVNVLKIISLQCVEPSVIFSCHQRSLRGWTAARPRNEALCGQAAVTSPVCQPIGRLEEILQFSEQT